jgi:hypothetical protein
MRIDVYHHIVVDDGVHQKLDAILTAVSKAVTGVETLQRSAITMSKELDDLRDRVAHSIEVEQSAVALIQGLAQQIRDNAQDPPRSKNSPANSTVRRGRSRRRSPRTRRPTPPVGPIRSPAAPGTPGTPVGVRRPDGLRPSWRRWRGATAATLSRPRVRRRAAAFAGASNLLDGGEVDRGARRSDRIVFDARNRHENLQHHVRAGAVPWCPVAVPLPSPLNEAVYIDRA